MTTTAVAPSATPKTAAPTAAPKTASTTGPRAAPVDRGEQEWRTNLCDAGEGCDCPRSCFIGCDQFGRTRHRLERLKRQEDPSDLSGYDGCNVPCWDYFLLCIGSLYIGSGIYTAKETKRIRMTYDIKGSYGDDVAKGIFCQPCSLIRNELEVRRREGGKQHFELAKGLFPPVPLGETEFQPMFAMAGNEGYKPEPQMNAGREVHLHPQEQGGPRMIPMFPNGFDQLPPIPHIASPLSNEGLSRRAQLLTPISERDSGDSARIQQQRENIPNFPQVQNWLQSMGPSSKGKPTLEKAVLVAGPCNPPAVVSPCPGPSAKPLKKKRGKKSRQSGSPDKLTGATARCPECTGKPHPPDDLTAIPTEAPAAAPEAETPEIITTPSERPKIRITGSKAPHQHDITVDIKVPSSSESRKPHSIQVDVRVPTPETMPTPEHNLSADERVDTPQPTASEHRLSHDKRIKMVATPTPGHGLSSDPVIDEPDDEGSDMGPDSHSLPDDDLVAVSLSPLLQHDLESDSRVATPKPLPPRDHSISKDKRVSTPVSRVLSHGIHLDERVPTPELKWLNLEHNILQDPQVLSRSPVIEEHDLHADERVKSPALFPARQHSIHSDTRVTEQPSPIREHGIHADDTVASPSLRRSKEHSLSADNKVAQRAHQLLEQFLEQDKKSSRAGSKSSSRAGSRAER
ncbi:hypothetical protein B0H63DRAFT_564516 [Podospora didyma]|uniref:Uncharacterized protein n=1 Tax=Podospora didyma TaxID=330526 RepID=A0AAE0K663_9PEZI|nr:hypothetical protein B0H63DRAFT_564516 [Podospora didyma]